MEKHHRQLRRSGDDRPVNILLMGHLVHKWAQEHPEQARELGWIVSQYDDPAEISVVIPDEILTEIKPEKKPRQKLAPRQRAVVQVRVPQDEREKGSEVLETLIDAGREEWAEDMGWKDDVPAYFVSCAAFVKALQ